MRQDGGLRKRIPLASCAELVIFSLHDACPEYRWGWRNELARMDDMSDQLGHTLSRNLAPANRGIPFLN
jgi:hypothetical protein